MNKSTVLAIALAFSSVWVVMAAGFTAVWLTEEVRVIGLIALPAAIVASLLVLYFDWRARLQRRIPAERDARHEPDKAA
jgi:putative Mn2+ efflux pump MntP